MSLEGLPWQDVTPPKPKRGTFNAMYEGVCGGGDIICPGEEVCYYQDELWHADCAETDAEVPPCLDDWSTIPTCGRCWTQHRGECP